ncbi:MAG: cysteine synthase family protein [Planctomycetota bacterium]
MDAPHITITPHARSFLQGVDLATGPTPLVELKGLDSGPCRVLAKLEYMNPTGSIKDRVAADLIADAEATGRLRPGMTIVEGSSGNATIAIGAVARRRGYKVLAFLPRAMSEEKRRLHAALGVECEFFGPDPDRPFNNVRRDEAVALAAAQPDQYCCFDQFSNPVNIRAHERATGAEIWRQVRQLGGGIDHYFAGAGTGGSLVGISRALKRPGRLPRIEVTMVDPVGSTLTDRFHSRQPSEAHQAAPDGLGERFVPGNLDMAIVDHAVYVDRQDAVESCADLVRTSGILGGTCSGFTLHAALAWCRRQTERKTALVLVCDRGENYLSDAQYAGAIASAHGASPATAAAAG